MCTVKCLHNIDLLCDLFPDTMESLDLEVYEHDDLEYLKRIIHSMRNYQQCALNQLSHKQKALSLCSLAHKEILMNHKFGDYLHHIMNSIEANQELLQDILKLAQQQLKRLDLEPDRKTFLHDFARLEELFLQISREWSSEGATVRQASFEPILEDLMNLYPVDQRPNTKVLIPGSGLSRLAFDAACQTFDCTVNEQSMLNLFTANLILNKCTRINNYRVYPWIHNLNNKLEAGGTTRPVAFPDIDPTIRPDHFRFQVIPGDFQGFLTRRPDLEGHFDCVLTSFVLDSSHNVMDMVEVIGKCLKPKGKWINFGPLNYAYAKYPGEMSLELSWDLLREVIKASKFKFVKEDTHRICPYVSDQNSMSLVNFKCIYFIVEKTR